MLLSKTMTFHLPKAASFRYLIAVPLKYYLMFDSTCWSFSLFGTCFISGLACFLRECWDDLRTTGSCGLVGLLSQKILYCIVLTFLLTDCRFPLNASNTSLICPLFSSFLTTTQASTILHLDYYYVQTGLSVNPFSSTV